MEILVTGGGGFLGQAIVRRLLDRGDRVRVFNRGHYAELEAMGVVCFQGDIADPNAVSHACLGVEAVIHVAAKAGSGLVRSDFFNANVIGTNNVLDACQRHEIPYLVHTSSPSVVHAGGDIEGGDETLPYPSFYSAPYPETKALAERAVLATHSSGLQACALRPHLIWGPGDNQLLPRLIEKNRTRGIRLPAPDKRIDTVYIDNAADAHVLALDALIKRTGAAGRAFFISNGEPIAIEEMMSRLLVAVGQTPNIKTISPKLAHCLASGVEAYWRWTKRTDEPPVSRFVIEHLETAHWYRLDQAKQYLAYQPSVSLSEGFQRLKERY
jgi:nucleoside-diphosphate-sugar epimerase